MHCGIAGPFCGLGIGRAAHGRVSWSAADYNGHTAIGRLLHHGGLCELDEQLALARLQQGLGEDTLLPVAALHGECGRGCALDAAGALRLIWPAVLVSNEVRIQGLRTRNGCR